jgi:TRAP-type mannitol/chloroaromatic compound transport system substrate-binding protein
MSKVKTLVFLGLAFILAISLVAVACAPKAAPTGDMVPKADLTKAQSDLAAEKQKSASLQTQLAAAQKPAKVYRMEPAVWIGSGTPYDFLVYMADWLSKTSNGRIVSTPSAPGAVCPVEETIEAAAAGTTMAMLSTPSYYPGKIPLAALYNTSIGLNSSIDMLNCYETFNDGEAMKLYYGKIEKQYNVIVAGERVGEVDGIWSSKINIPNVDAFKGMKFRCGDEHFAVPISMFGGSTVWFPGTEIYTSLATGVIDAFTYGSAYDHLSLGVQEVTEFWGPRNYPIMGANNEQFVVNKDAWNEMGADLQNMIKEAIEAANQRSNVESFYMIADSWAKAMDAGVTPVNWTKEDNVRWVANQMEWAKKYTDEYPEDARFMQIVSEYRTFMGQ